MMSKPPSGLISATMATILEVPMSSPTMRLPLSLGLFIALLRTSCTGRVPRTVVDGKTVGISQVDALRPTRQTLQGTRVCCREPPQLFFYLAYLVATQLQHRPIVEPELPRPPVGQQHLHRMPAKRLQQPAEHQVATCHLGSTSIGRAKHRKSFVCGRFKQLAVGVDERVF